MSDRDDGKRELLTELDNEWHTLRHGNPVPGLYLQTGAEVVKVKGGSTVVGDMVITKYEIVVSDQGTVVGRYHVTAEEQTANVEQSFDE